MYLLFHIVLEYSIAPFLYCGWECLTQVYIKEVLMNQLFFRVIIKAIVDSGASLFKGAN